MGIPPSNERNRSVALVRSLGTVAAGNEEYLVFAKNAVLSHEPIRLLSGLVGEDGLFPLSRRGEQAFKQAEAALSAALDFSVPYGQALKSVKAAYGNLAELDDLSRQSLRDPDSLTADVIPLSESHPFASFRSQHLSALCYFVAQNYGVEKLSPLRYLNLDTDDAESALEASCEALNQLRQSLAGTLEYGEWVIEQISPIDSDFLPPVNGFVFRWLDEAPYEGVVRDRSLVELAPGFATGVSHGLRCYAGRGFIIGTQPTGSHPLKELGVHTELPPHAFSGYRENYDDPIGMISQCFDGDRAFCIDPQQFAAALDRFDRCLGVVV